MTLRTQEVELYCSEVLFPFMPLTVSASVHIKTAVTCCERKKVKVCTIVIKNVKIPGCSFRRSFFFVRGNMGIVLCQAVSVNISCASCICRVRHFITLNVKTGSKKVTLFFSSRKNKTKLISTIIVIIGLAIFFHHATWWFLVRSCEKIEEAWVLLLFFLRLWEWIEWSQLPPSQSEFIRWVGPEPWITRSLFGRLPSRHHQEIW